MHINGEVSFVSCDFKQVATGFIEIVNSCNCDESCHQCQVTTLTALEGLNEYLTYDEQVSPDHKTFKDLLRALLKIGRFSEDELGQTHYLRYAANLSEFDGVSVLGGLQLLCRVCNATIVKLDEELYGNC